MSKDRIHTVAVDLDGVILKYDKYEGNYIFGEPIEGAREFLKTLVKSYQVVIYTARPVAANMSVKVELEKWLDKHKLPYNRIWTGQGKPHASAYVDDRGVACVPQEKGEVAYRSALRSVAKLVNRNKVKKT